MVETTTQSATTKQVAVRLDDEDLAALKECARLDKLSDSDTMRRAIRHYRRHLATVHGPVDTV